jgi:ribonuclease T2
MEAVAQFRSLLPTLPSPQQLLQWPLIAVFLPWSKTPTSDRPSAASSCTDAQLSCHNNSAVADTCCFNYPGGQFLQTQFWDTNPPNGPKDSWTLHGLWPDHCNGDFDQFCDDTRSHNNITAILTSLGATDLLSYMSIYWRADSGSDEHLWSHEWNKHGTCISTLEKRCYNQGQYRPEEEVLDYFRTAVNLFKSLDTYKTLAEASIIPRYDQTYPLSQLQRALEAKQGVEVTLRCHGNQLDEVWYHFDVLGSVQTGKFVPAPPDGAKTNCPREGVRYLPKGEDSRPTSTITRTGTVTRIEPTSTSPPGPFREKGHLKVIVNGDSEGCLISNGYWYNSGTCAGFRVQDDAKELEDDHLFTLISSKGPCSIYEGSFQCAKNLPVQTVFSANGSKLAFQGSTTFSARSKPGRFEKVAVHPESDADGNEVVLEIEWSEL